MLKIKNLTFQSDAVMAPLAGFTDVAFRSIVASYGAAYTHTEMVSAKGLCYNSDKTKELLYTTENEKIVAVQLFGSEPEFIKKAIERKELDKFQIIDINMGCPVTKIVKNGEGSKLMTTPDIAYEVVRAAISASSNRPVTVKMRRGFYQDEDNSLDFAKVIEQAGASAITVHGRYKEQMYSGKSDRGCVKIIKENISIPVIANGDVFNYQDYVDIKKETNRDGVAIARGALGNPSIFLDILRKEKKMSKKEEILLYIDILKDFYKFDSMYKMIKTQIAFFFKGEKNSAKARSEVTQANSLDEILLAVNRYL